MIKKFNNSINMDLDFKELLHGSFISFIIKALGLIHGYIVVLVISKMYGAEIVGIYNISFSLIMLLGMISTLGLNVALLRYVGQYINKSNDKLRYIYFNSLKISLSLSVLLGIIFFISTEYIGNKLFQNDLYVAPLKYISFFLPFVVLTNIDIEFIRGIKKIKISEYLRNINRPLFVIILLLILKPIVDSELLSIYVLGISIFITSLISIFIVIKKVLKFEKIANTSQSMSNKEILRTSIPMMITAMSLYLLNNIGLYILEYYSSTKDVGIYSVVIKISTLVGIALLVVNIIAAPKFSELFWSKKYIQLQNIIHNANKVIFICAIIIFLIISIFNIQILNYFGQDFIVGSNALLILCLGQLVYAFSGLSGIFLNMTGNEKVLKYVTLLSLFVSLLSNLILIPIYGLNGAALATLISYTTLSIVPAVYTKKNMGYTIYFTLKNNKI